MPALLALLLCWAIVLVINVVPAFMPPSWAVMAVFRLAGDLPLLPLTIGGALMSALGRAALALLSRRAGGKLPDKDRENAEALGQFIGRHRRWRFLIVFGYCLGPLPSNPVFIAAGVGEVPLLGVTIAFFLSRAIADTFWVWTAGKISEGLGDVFLQQVTSWKSIAVQVVTLILLVLVFRLPWARWLGLRRRSRRRAQGAGDSSTADQSDPAGSARNKAYPEAR
jgi:membrane protein DedA with SNARE-associated domain